MSSASSATAPAVDAAALATAMLKQRADNKDPTDFRKEFNASKSKMKVDIKKATAFGKKMRTFTAEQEKGILQDLQTISVGMFVSEAAQGVGPAVWDGKMKLSDAVPFVNSMSAIHQRYEAFLPEALQGLQSGFAAPLQQLLDECTTKLDMVGGTTADLTKFRVAVRIMCELYMQGLIPTPKFFVVVVSKIVAALEAKPVAHVTVNVLNVVLIILRAMGLEMTHLGFIGSAGCALAFNDAGVTSSSIVAESKKISGVDATIANESGFTHIEQIPKKQRAEYTARLAPRRVEPYASQMMAPQNDRDEFVKKVTRIAEFAVDLCDKLRKEVENKWRQLCELTELQGEIATEKRELFGAFKRETERFIVLTENLIGMMGLGPTEGEEKNGDAGSPATDGDSSATGRKILKVQPIDLLGALKNSNVDQSVVLVASSMAEFFTVRNAESVNHYDTEEQREFYEHLIDIDELIPEGIPTRLVARPVDSKNKNNGKYNDADNDNYDDYDEEEKDGAAIDLDDEAPVPITLTERNNEKVVANYDAINELLARVYDLPTAEAADEWVKAFLNESCKYFKLVTNPLAGALTFFNGCRRKLQKALRFLGRCNHETVPMVARVVATLSKRIEDLAEPLAKKVEGELTFAVKKHSPTAYLRKMRSTRYLCELVKFRVAPPLAVIKLFQLALKEIENPHSTEIILILISNVTSFLLRGGVTRVRAEDYLKQLKEVRINKGVCIGSGQEAMLEQTISELNEVMAASANGGANSRGPRVNTQRKRSALEQYFRYLLFTELTEETLEEVCQSIRLMPWAMSCEQGLEAANATTDAPAASDANAAPALLDPSASANGEKHYSMLIRVFRKAHQCRWDRLHVLAEALADTCDYYPAVGAAVADMLLEDIRTDLTVAASAHHKVLREMAIQSLRLKAAQQLADGTASSTATTANGGGGDAAAQLAAALNTNKGGDGGEQEKQSKSSLAKHLAKSLEPSRNASGLYAQVSARTNQKMMVDIKYMAELYNNRVLEFRTIAFTMAQLVMFYPNPDSSSSSSSSSSTGGSSSSALLSEQQRARLSNGTGAGAQLYNYFVINTNPVDYSRIRFICGLLDTFMPYVSVGTKSASTLSASEKAVLERLLARLFLLIHSKAKPFPMDLDYKIAETMQLCADVLYPYPDGYEHLRTGERIHIKKISEVPEGELAAFQTNLEIAAEKRLKREYSKKDWGKKSSTQRRELKQSMQKEILKSGDFSAFPPSKVTNPVPWSIIGSLLLDAVSRKKHEKDYRETMEKGDEVKEAPVVTRPFYFPRSRAEAEAHLEYMLQPIKGPAGGGRGNNAAAAANKEHPANLAPAHAILAKQPIYPEMPKGHTLSKTKKKYYDDLRLLTISAIPTAPTNAPHREATWFEAICGLITAAATNGGVIHPVISRSDGALAALQQQQQQEAMMEAAPSTTTSAVTNAEGGGDGTRAVPVESKNFAGRNTRRNKNRSGTDIAEVTKKADADDSDDDDERLDSGSSSSDDDDDDSIDSASTSSSSSSASSSSSSSDDDDDDVESIDERILNAAGDDDDEDGRGPAIGPQAFGLQLGGGNKTSSATNATSSSANNNNMNGMMNGGRRPEDAEIDRMMQQMLLESTGKALQRETVLDKRLEQRLSNGYYRSAVDKIMPADSIMATRKEAPPPMLMKRRPPPTDESTAAASSGSSAAPTAPPTHTQFALIRRNNKGNAEAKPFMVPNRSEFAQHVDDVIAEGQRERATALKTTIILSKQQDAERAEEIRQKQLREAQAALAAAAAASSGRGATVVPTYSKEERIGSLRFGKR